MLPLKVVLQMIPNFNLERRGTQWKSKEIFFTAVNKERGSFCSFFQGQEKQLNKRKTCCKGEHRSAVRSLLPTLPCSPSPCWPIVLWDWSISRLLQTGLGAPVAPVILCGFGSVTAAWLIYGALITPPPGGLRGAWRVTCRKQKKSIWLNME